MTLTGNKDKKIQIRLKAAIKEDFVAIAEHRGLTPTALIHSYIVKTVHEAKQETPEIFAHFKNKDSKSKTAESSGELEKIAVKAKKGKSGNPAKTFTNIEGATIPLYDEATSFDEDEEQ